MGSLTLPASGRIYVDSNCVIYSVEKITPYDGLLDVLWAEVTAGRLSAVSSQLSLLETLVKPIRIGDTKLESDYRAFLLESRGVEILPIDLAVLTRAARIRAETGLKTPDAVHAATAIECGAALFVTNDPAFSKVRQLDVGLLSGVAGIE
jgi:predicted nucleic acid-binding protein